MKRLSNSIVVLLFASLVVLFSLTRYADYDLWWHLKLGENVYTTCKPLITDTFSYTFSGKPQYAGEWIADLIIFLAYHAGGIAGVNLLKAFILLAAFFFLYKTLRASSRDDEAGFGAVILTMLLVLFAIRFRLFVRPYLFSLFFVSFFLFILSRLRKEGNTAILSFLPPAQIVWSNISVGAVLGPFIFLVFGLDACIRDRKKIVPYLLLFVVLLACTLANPETYRLYSLTFDLSSDPYRALVGEYQPMNAQLLWGYGLRYTVYFQALALGAAVYFLFMGGWRNFLLLFLFIVFLAESLLQVRMVEFFSFLAAPAFALFLEKPLDWMNARLSGRGYIIHGIASAVMILVIPLSVINNTTYVFGSSVKEDAFPEKALAFLDREQITGTMFNSYSFGGYIIWRSPERKVFIDGRYRRLYTPEFYKLYSDMVSNAADWQSAGQRFGFDYALVEYDLLSQRFPLHLNENPDWALVYWDASSAVYLKRTQQNLKTIGLGEYRTIKPAFNDFRMLEHILGSKPFDYPLVERINTDISLNPSNQEPRLAKAYVLFSMGRSYYREALDELKITETLKPDLVIEHSAAAFMLHQLGMTDEARRENERALALNPQDRQSLELKELLGRN